ncbi:CW-type Zinc Finger protein [Besnoitia besnoiti]|uniref:CW-type Zinc Finger protein n=1 Tax=Besnoitia besnoiti TaxID=94643 RepID=A0A2A9M8T4_BESBE|nr:CW-type Zinc Finger protein [Besnoitia besnoiti]PFH34385.1 CW-type Zinc Finger protein [Besnoitia besnoiti]
MAVLVSSEGPCSPRPSSFGARPHYLFAIAVSVVLFLLLQAPAAHDGNAVSGAVFAAASVEGFGQTETAAESLNDRASDSKNEGDQSNMKQEEVLQRESRTKTRPVPRSGGARRRMRTRALAVAITLAAVGPGALYFMRRAEIAAVPTAPAEKPAAKELAPAPPAEAEETLPEEAEAEKKFPEEAETEKTLPEEAEPEKRFPEEAEPEKRFPEEAEPEKRFPEEAEVEKTFPEEADAEKTDLEAVVEATLREETGRGQEDAKEAHLEETDLEETARGDKGEEMESESSEVELEKVQDSKPAAV